MIEETRGLIRRRKCEVSSAIAGVKREHGFSEGQHPQPFLCRSCTLQALDRSPFPQQSEGATGWPKLSLGRAKGLAVNQAVRVEPATIQQDGHGFARPAGDEPLIGNLVQLSRGSPLLGSSNGQEVWHLFAVHAKNLINSCPRHQPEAQARICFFPRLHFGLV